jgi:hypothetical protein
MQTHSKKGDGRVEETHPQRAGVMDEGAKTLPQAQRGPPAVAPSLESVCGVGRGTPPHIPHQACEGRPRRSWAVPHVGATLGAKSLQTWLEVA